MRPVTPRGFKDVLPAEAAEREAITARVSEAMSRWGYGLVETPVAEEFVTLEAGAGSSLEGAAFRLFDSDGTLLALRPEMTVPIARLAATRLCEEPGPFRMRYTAEVFREQASMRGRSRQFTQTGLELIGAGGPVADAEIVGVLVESLQAAGLPEFSVGIGTVAVLRSLIDASGMPASWGAAVLDAAHERNLVGIDACAAQEGVPADVAEALRSIPRIRGDKEAIDRCRALAVGDVASAALAELSTTWDLLDAAGLTRRVRVDFGIMRSFDYYTGMVLEVYAPGVGLPLGGGGRYDEVMAEFECPAAAAGFAIGVERLHGALTAQQASPQTSGLDAVLGGPDADAFEAASRLRSAGWSVRLSARIGRELVEEAQEYRAAEALVANDSDIVRLDREGQLATALSDPVPEPPTSSWADVDRELGEGEVPR